MEIFKASHQWATRPADERFASLEDLYSQTRAYHESARTKDVPFGDLRVEADNGEVLLSRKGTDNKAARLTHWAFGQLAARVGAPASYLRDLPATLAAQNLNHGLAHRIAEYGEENVARLLFHHNGSLILRAITSDRYEPRWNYEIAQRLVDLKRFGWDGAKPTMRFDGGDINECQRCNGTGSLNNSCFVCKGTGRVLPALYASDHDMFAFITNQNSIVAEVGTDAPLYRGFIIGNSEVGGGSLFALRFLFRNICGNFIVWGAEKVIEVSLRHVGEIREKFGVISARIREYADESPSEEEAKIKSVKHKLIAATKDEVLNALFGMRSLGISRKALEASYDAIQPNVDGEANTVWGFVQGVTRYSQSTPYADERMKLDRAAGKILDADF